MTEALGRIVPVARESVEDRVAIRLRDLIGNGELPEGTPLVQRDLAARLGVSQTPIRLALTELQRAGLVEVGDTGRATVTRLTREDLEEIYAARLGLEGLAARVGAGAVASLELARMRDLLADLRRLARDRDVDTYLRTRWRFHASCYEAARRPRLLSEVERLYWRSARYNRVVLSSRDRFRKSLGHYQRFYDACAVRDGFQAEKVIHDSTRWAVDLIWASLPSEAA